MYIQRQIQTRILEALTDTPVIIVNGPRQSGKSTLVKHALEGYDFTYFTFDDATTFNAAKKDPQGFIQGLSGTTIIDEVQMVPELFKAIKLSVDLNRQPGRFILTGSADIMALPTISESLTGRMELVTLWPFAQLELNDKTGTFVDVIFKAPDTLPAQTEPLNKLLLARLMISGGYPEIQSRNTDRRRNAWYESYLTGILQRDIRELAQIDRLALIPDLLTHLAARMGSTINYSELTRVTGTPNTSLKRYLTHLEHIFLIKKIYPWSGNISKTLVKSPKYIITDTGLASFLLGLESAEELADSRLFGAVLESFVMTEILKQLTWADSKYRMYHFRAHSGSEIDLIIQDSKSRLIGIEVKSAASVNKHAFKGLVNLKKETGNKFYRGFVLYTGNTKISFGKDMMALPINSIF